jgi:hypothetical protein
MAEPDNLVLELLRGIRADMATKNELAKVKADIGGLNSGLADVRSEMHSLRADVASDLLTTRKEIGDQIVGLRMAVVEYHSAVIGHGIIISELEARVRRMEQHLKLPEMGGH